MARGHYWEIIPERAIQADDFSIMTTSLFIIPLVIRPRKKESKKDVHIVNIYKLE